MGSRVADSAQPAQADRALPVALQLVEDREAAVVDQWEEDARQALEAKVGRKHRKVVSLGRYRLEQQKRGQTRQSYWKKQAGRYTPDSFSCSLRIGRQGRSGNHCIESEQNASVYDSSQKQLTPPVFPRKPRTTTHLSLSTVPARNRGSLPRSSLLHLRGLRGRGTLLIRRIPVSAVDIIRLVGTSRRIVGIMPWRPMVTAVVVVRRRLTSSVISRVVGWRMAAVAGIIRIAVIRRSLLVVVVPAVTLARIARRSSILMGRLERR